MELETRQFESLQNSNDQGACSRYPAEAGDSSRGALKFADKISTPLDKPGDKCFRTSD